MKLIRIILKLKKYFDYYNIYNGVIEDKYHFTSLEAKILMLYSMMKRTSATE